MARQTPSPHRSSIRTRLNLLVIGAVTLSTLPAAAVIAGDAIQREAQTRWAMASGAAELLAGNAIDAARGHNAAEASAVVRAATRIPDVAYARLDLPSGQLLAEAGTGSHLATDIMLNAEAPHPHVTGLAFHPVVRVVAPVREGPNTLGEITIVQSSGDFSPALLRALAGILILSGCALAGSLYLARRMQNAMTCPLGELTQSMDAVRRYGDVSQRVVTHSRDEIGALVDSYNLMLEALARRGVDTPATASAPTEAVPETFAETVQETPLEAFPVEILLVEAETAPLAPEVVPDLIEETVSEIIPASAPEIADTGDVDVLDLADDLVARFAAAARAKGLELVTSADPAAPRLAPGSAARLGEVIAALIDNALKFTETGRVSLEIATDPKPDFWRLIVHDTGIGIPRAELKTILKTNDAEAATSRGLRLPAARQVIEAMGGAMAVTSDEGGSQFHIRLPALPDAPTAAPPRANGRTVAIRVSAPAERDALTTRFAAAGVTITEDADGADLVLADLTARDQLSVPADRLVLLTGPEGDDQAWVAQGRAWAGLRRPLRYGDIDALIDVMARDAVARADADEAAGTPVVEEDAEAIDVITVAPEHALDLYPKQAPEALAQIVAAFQTRNAAAMAEAAHLLTSLSQGIGARSVAEAAEDIERAIRVESRAVTIDEVARLHARLERTLATLAEADTPDALEALAG